MAVIKIVPMPGAVGDKGDEGAVGPRGQQGETGLQGPAGADALWSYNGPWQSNASYAQGDVVTYQGQLYYVKAVTTAGTLPTDTSKFDLLAAKGTDSIVPTSGTWETNIPLRSGIVGGVYPSSDSLGRYYTIGDLVFIEVHFAVAQPTSWGSGFDTFMGELPFKIAGSWQDDVSSASMRHRLKGQMTLRGDAEPFGTPYQDNEQNFISVDIVLVPNTTSVPDTFLIAAEGEAIGPNTNVNSTYVISRSWPVNLEVPNNGNSPYLALRFSGVYRKA